MLESLKKIFITFHQLQHFLLALFNSFRLLYFKLALTFCHSQLLDKKCDGGQEMLTPFPICKCTLLCTSLTGASHERFSSFLVLLKYLNFNTWSIETRICCITFISNRWFSNNWLKYLFFIMQTVMNMWNYITPYYKAFCKTTHSTPLQTGGYPTGIFHFISKLRENHFVQISTFLETKLYD